VAKQFIDLMQHLDYSALTTISSVSIVELHLRRHVNCQPISCFTEQKPALKNSLLIC